MIEEKHPVRKVNSVVDPFNIKPLDKQYKGGGAGSYSPRMLFKVLVYSYLWNIYSSRKIGEMTKENIHMMWLSGMSRPDHHTVNRFRSECHHTVEAALKRSVDAKYSRPEKSNLQLEKYREIITEMALNPKLKGSRILLEIKSLGYNGSEAAFYRFLLKLRQPKVKYSTPYETAPADHYPVIHGVRVK